MKYYQILGLVNMELKVYFPNELNTVGDLTDVIFDPIFYMDYLLLKWFDTSIEEYFPNKKYTAKLFIGGKEFQSTIEKPPIFALQSISGYQLSDEFTLGPSQLLPHAMKLNHTSSSDDVENVYSKVMPVSAEYQIDAFMDLRLDVNKFNLWYMDQWSSFGIQHIEMPGVRLYNKSTGTYEPYKFYIKKGSGSFSHNWDLEGTGLTDVIYMPSASLLVETIMFRNMGAFPEAKTLIIKYLLTDFDMNNLSFVNGETGEETNESDTAHYKELLEEAESAI